MGNSNSNEEDQRRYTSSVLSSRRAHDMRLYITASRNVSTGIIATDDGITMFHQERVQIAMISQDTENSQQIAAISDSNCTYRQTKTTYNNQPFYRCQMSYMLYWRAPRSV